MRRVFALAIFVLVLAMLVVLAVLRGQNNARQRVIHTRQVLQHIELTLSSVKDAETGQGGYLLTGDDTLLAPYRSSLATLPGTLQELERLIRDNPVQQAALIQVRSEIEDKLASAQAALEALMDDQGINLVFTDLMMGVLLTTGYAGSTLDTEAEVAILLKPYEMKTLDTALSAALGKSA